jgi:PAS domain-containing protein
LSSSRIGTVILDEDLRIRRYSPQAAKVFNITPIDTGRPLMHLTHNLENFDAGARAFEVQRSGVPYEGQARSQAGGHYLARILPYQIAPGAFAGVVITVIDVTPLKEATAKVELALQSELDVVEHMPTGLFVYEAASDGDFVLVSGNKAGEKLSGVKVSESVGRSFRELWPGESGRKLASKLLEVGRTGATVTEPEMRYEDERFSGVFSVVAFPLPGGRVAVGFEDLGERQQLEARVRRAARQQESQLRLLQDAEVAARMGSWTWDVAEDKVDWSDNLYRLFRRDPGLGAPSFAEHAVLYNADSMDLLREAVARALQPGEPYALELIAVRSDGTKMRCIARGIPEFDERGQVVRVYGSLQEVG